MSKNIYPRELEKYSNDLESYVAIFRHTSDSNSLRWVNFVSKIAEDFKNVKLLIIEWKDYNKSTKSKEINNFYSIMLLDKNTGIKVFSDPSSKIISKIFQIASACNSLKTGGINTASNLYPISSEIVSSISSPSSLNTLKILKNIPISDLNVILI